MNVLVYGAAGVGKSQFIAECTGKEVKTGRSRRGVTKSVEKFMRDEPGSQWVSFIDCPGVGDKDCPVDSVLHDLNSKFAKETFGAVVFVVKGDETRFGLASQYVTEILKLAFKDNGEWSQSTILLATHWDKVDDDEEEVFKQELHGTAREIADMANMAPIPANQIIMKKKGEVEAILDCLERVGHGKGLIFQVPDNEDLVRAWGRFCYPHADAETVRKAYLENFQAPREANVLMNLHNAVENSRYDLLQYWLVAAKHVFMDDAKRKDALVDYDVKKSEWDMEIYDAVQYIQSGQMGPDMILDLARDNPYMYDETIKQYVFHVKQQGS